VVAAPTHPRATALAHFEPRSRKARDRVNVDGNSVCSCHVCTELFVDGEVGPSSECVGTLSMTMVVAASVSDRAEGGRTFEPSGCSDALHAGVLKLRREVAPFGSPAPAAPRV